MQLSDAMFYRLRNWMKEQTGVHFPEAKRSLVHQRLLRRLTARHVGTFEAYFRLLQAPGEDEERLAAIDLLTTHETYFFREPKHFDWLQTRLLLHKQAGTRPFRVWSAACSSGEEVWSLAMLLDDLLGGQAAWYLLGSDISQPVLDKAMRGHYSMQRLEGLSLSYLKKYCLKGVRQYAGSMLVCKSLRQQVKFELINLDKTLPALGTFNVVFLRNVLIYFDQETKARVVMRVLEKIEEGGFLLVSHSESLHGLGLPVELVKPGIYKKRSC